MLAHFLTCTHSLSVITLSFSLTQSEIQSLTIIEKVRAVPSHDRVKDRRREAHYALFLSLYLSFFLSLSHTLLICLSVLENDRAGPSDGGVKDCCSQTHHVPQIHGRPLNRPFLLIKNLLLNKYL